MTTTAPRSQMNNERPVAETSASGQAPSFVSSASASTPGATTIDWERVLHENEKWMRPMIAVRVGEYAAVDEVFQEIALAATRQQAPIRDPAKVGAWLYRLVVIQSALYRRKMGRKRNLLKRYENDAASSRREREDVDPLEWLIQEERRELVRGALEELREDERSVLLMKYQEDKSYQEIAEELKTTSLAVQSKLHRARGRLRKILARILAESDDSNQNK